MDENLHNIEDLFQSALDDNEETPSRNVWEAVDKRLDKDNIVSIKRKYTNIKRIAVLLLFLLASFALFDVYKINNIRKGNGFAKTNDTADSSNQNKSGTIADNTANSKNGANSAFTSDTNKTLVNGKGNVVPGNSAIANKNLPNNQTLPQPIYSPTSLQKQKINAASNSGKDMSDQQTAFASGQKKKYTNKSAYRVKIKNATAIEDEESLVKNIDVQQDDKISELKGLKNISRAKIEFLSQDSIGTNKLNQVIGVSKIKITDTSNKTIAKLLKKKFNKPSRFSVTPFFSPDIAWYRLMDDNVSNQSDNASEFKKEENHEFSSTYGALVDYKINKHWGIQSGLTMANTNITVQPKTIYAQQDNTGIIKYRVNTSSGYGYVLPAFSANPVVGDSLYAFTSTHSLQYIGIPAAITYNIVKSKFKFNAMAGVAVNFLTRAKLETTVEKGFNNAVETVDNLQGLKKVYFSGVAGLGADYKLSNKTALTFAPTIRVALNAINKNAPVKSYPVSMGFVMGLKIGL